MTSVTDKINIMFNNIENCYRTIITNLSSTSAYNIIRDSVDPDILELQYYNIRSTIYEYNITLRKIDEILKCKICAESTECESIQNLEIDTFVKRCKECILQIYDSCSACVHSEFNLPLLPLLNNIYISTDITCLITNKFIKLNNV